MIRLVVKNTFLEIADHNGGIVLDRSLTEPFCSNKSPVVDVYLEQDFLSHADCCAIPPNAAATSTVAASYPAKDSDCGCDYTRVSGPAGAYTNELSAPNVVADAHFPAINIECSSDSAGMSGPANWYNNNLSTQNAVDNANTGGAIRVPYCMCPVVTLLGTLPTTVMIRNIPNDYRRWKIEELLNHHNFKGKYDFVYLPFDFNTGSNKGYSFINFVSYEEALRACEAFDGFNQWTNASQKCCAVAWASPLQGLDAHIKKYRNNSVMHRDIPDEYKPKLYDQHGNQVPLPAPEREPRKPRFLKTGTRQLRFLTACDT